MLSGHAKLKVFQATYFFRGSKKFSKLYYILRFSLNNRINVKISNNCMICVFFTYLYIVKRYDEIGFSKPKMSENLS